MKCLRAVLLSAALLAATAAAAAAQDPSAPVFDENGVANYTLSISAGDWNTIVNDPAGQGQVWKPATFTWQGETVSNVGVRAAKSYDPGHPKPSIRIKFDEFVPGRRWRDLDVIKLDSILGNVDPSMMCERLSFWVHRQAGMAAPRACHARLTVNGDFKGLYEVLEPIRKAFVRHHWGIANPDGNLYELDYIINGSVVWGFDQYLWRGPGPATYVPGIFHPETNEVGGNYQDVVDFLNVLNNAPASSRRSQLEGVINLDKFLLYLAVTIATSNYDALLSHADSPNNHSWYHRDNTNRLEIVPWDQDVSFGNWTTSTWPLSGVDGGTRTMPIWWKFGSTRATSWIQGDSVASATYKSKIRQVVDGPFASLQSRANFVYNQIRSHIYADPYKPFTNAQFENAVVRIRDNWIPQRIASLNSQVPPGPPPPPPPPPPTGSNNAQYLSNTIPSTLAAGATATVTVAMKNTGTTTWTGSGKYALGHSAGATPWTWRERRVWLAAGESVAPGATKTFSFSITAPSTPGSHAFPSWRMVQDGVEYFGTASPALTINVTGAGGGGTVTRSFQQGVSPTAAYAGARDATITRDTPAANFGGGVSLTVDGDTTGTGNDARALLRWYVTDIPVGSTVQSARIVLNVSNSSTQTYELYRVYRYWSETQATWNESQAGTPWQVAGADGSGDRGQTVRGAVTGSATGTVTITLNSAGVSMAQAWVNDPASNFGLILLDSANTDGLVFASKEAATPSQRPRLEVTYAAPAVLDWVEIAPADSVIDGGENPLTLQEAFDEAGSTAGDGSGGGGGCGALGLEAALVMGLAGALRRRSR